MSRIEKVVLMIIVVILYSAALAKLIGIFPKKVIEYKISNNFPEDPDSEYQTVVEILDGDTIVLSSGKHVRYIGINAPEIAHEKRRAECFGDEATKKNASLVLGKRVHLVSDISDTDKYGRLLRYVFIDKLLINEILVHEGYAYAKIYPPDDLYQENIENAESYARNKLLGLWKECNLLR